MSAARPLPTRFDDSVRLIAEAYIDEAALAPLADTPQELAVLERLEQQTRHTGTPPVLPSQVSETELLGPSFGYGWRYVNAAFCYTHASGNRFNDASRGAWYAALGPSGATTAIAEVAFHLERELAATGIWENRTAYVALKANLRARCFELRTQPHHPALQADIAAGYPAGQRLAAQCRRDGFEAIRYPSVRHPGGQCIAVLEPRTIRQVSRDRRYRLSWSGGPGAKVATIP